MSEQNKQLEASIKKFTEALDSAKKDLDTKAFETSTKIMERSIIYADSVSDAKRPELEGVKDVNERLKIINSNNIETIKPETAKEWATVDVAEFKKIRDPNEREYAAIEMVNNSRVNKTYAAHLQEKEPNLYDGIKAINAANEKLVEEKEKAKDAHFPVNNKTISDLPKPVAENKNNELDSIEGQAKKDKEIKAIPEELNKKFLIKGDNDKAVYYHGNDTEREAFKDTGTKIIASSEGVSVARSMVVLAEAKGWENIKATGKEEFRREIWLEAQKRGIEVSGYTPTKQDLQNVEKLVNKITRDDEPQKNTTQATDNKPSTLEVAKTTVAAAAVVATADVSSAAEAAKVAAATTMAVKAAVVDIKSDSKPVAETARDLKEELREAYTNLPREDAVKKHPELQALYKLEQAAQQFANNTMSNLSKDDKDRFVTSVRDKGIDQISQGKTLPQIKERTIEKSQERVSEISR
jgi:hypothetical protein